MGWEKYTPEELWIDHYEDCEICMEGPEADEFNGGVAEYCTVGMRLRGDMFDAEARR